MKEMEGLSIKDVKFTFERHHAVGVFSISYNGTEETIHMTTNVDCKKLVIEKTIKRLNELNVSHNFEPIDKLYNCPYW